MKRIGMKTIVLLLLVTVWFCHTVPCYALPMPVVTNEENLLINGGFEMGDATGWIRNGDIQIVSSAYFIMNMAICGWNADQATNGGNLPQSMYVDYVRVYQKTED